jgi:dTMP kinase
LRTSSPVSRAARPSARRSDRSCWGLDERLIRDGLRIATGGLEPDLVLVLDLPPEEIEDRRSRDLALPDRIEREGEAFRRAVRDGYLELSKSEPSVEVVAASGTPQEVHERVRAILVERFPDPFARVATPVSRPGGA